MESVDLQTLFQAIELCRAATRTAGEDTATRTAKESEKDVLSGLRTTTHTGSDSDGAVSSEEEDWVEADPRPASPGKRSRELQLLQEIKNSVKNLTAQVKALKQERRRSNDASTGSVKDSDTEKAILSSMFPHTDCKHHTKIFYGNGSGHGLKCPQCNIKVFRHNKNDNISIKVPR